MNDESRVDLERLQGAWSQVYLEADGIADPPGDEHSAPGAICTFLGSEFRVVAQPDRLLLRGNFTLDATTRPKSITWVDAIGADAGKELPAIYQLTGEDGFVFVAADAGMPRPVEFKTRVGLTMRQFVRTTNLLA